MKYVFLCMLPIFCIFAEVEDKYSLVKEAVSLEFIMWKTEYATMISNFSTLNDPKLAYTAGRYESYLYLMDFLHRLDGEEPLITD